MAEKKGVKVSELAKEFGVENRVVLEVLKQNEAGDWAKTHNSSISFGQAATAREWIGAWKDANGSNVAVAVAEAPSSTSKRKGLFQKKKPAGEEQPSEGASESAPTENAPVVETAAPATVAEVEQPPEPIAPVVPEAVAVAETPVAEAPKFVEPAPVVVTEAPKPIAPAIPTAPPVSKLQPTQVTPLAPAARAPGATVPAAPGRPSNLQPPAPRPTVTLANRLNPTQQQSPVARAPITPAPQMVRPTPAAIQGPRVVREEKPDHVPAPRARRGPNDGPSTSSPSSFTTARPKTGGGVKSTIDEEEEKKKKNAKSLSTRRRGSDGRRGEADEKLREFSDQDLRDRSERLSAATKSRAEFDNHLKTIERRGTHQQMLSASERGGAIEIEEPITVKSLSATIGIKANEIITKLMKKGVFATINQAIDLDTAQLIAADFGIELAIAKQYTLEEELIEEFEAKQAAAENLVRRPAIVTILGHVDHGKTSLLDKIRSANVAAGEAGGITQHTAAWMVTVGEGEAKKRVTFIDTPGHQAFTAMRARGANMTDVVVLVVGAVEGVMPQTLESINHAKAAEVPIVVAMNKIDREDANPDMVLGQLAAAGLNPVEWGGDTEVVRTSALTGQGVQELIEILDYQSELLDLKADPSSEARGTVIESRVDEGLGSVATVLVQEGTLNVGDVILAGPGYGRIRSLIDDQGRQIKSAGPSTPVIISGLNALPSSGDKFFYVEDVDRAKSIAEDRSIRQREEALAGATRVTSANLLDTMRQTDIKTINLIIKGDVHGSVETLVSTVGAQNTQEVKVRVIHSGVGGITESDVQLALATKAKKHDNRVAIIGFNVVPEEEARQLAEQNHIDVKVYRVIYEIFDDLKKALSGMLSKEVREKLHGNAEIRQVFKFSKVGSIAGCMVTDGHIVRTDKIRLIRDGRIITEGLQIETLRRVKEDAKEVKAGFECGIKVAGYDDIKIGDRFQAYIVEEFERTL